MAMRLFLLYVVIELAVIVALASTIGFGWTVLLLLGTFVVGIALAGSQVKRHIRRLQSGLTAATVQGAAADSVLVALGTVLVVDPRSGQLRRRCAVAAAADPRGRPSAGDGDGRAPHAADHRSRDGRPPARATTPRDAVTTSTARSSTSSTSNPVPWSASLAHARSTKPPSK